MTNLEAIKYLLVFAKADAIKLPDTDPLEQALAQVEAFVAEVEAMDALPKGDYRLYQYWLAYGRTRAAVMPVVILDVDYKIAGLKTDRDEEGENSRWHGFTDKELEDAGKHAADILSDKYEYSSWSDALDKWFDEEVARALGKQDH